MIMEAWLLATALIFTVVGYRMGKENGMKVGIDGTLDMLVRLRYITVSELEDGDVKIEKVVD